MLGSVKIKKDGFRRLEVAYGQAEKLLTELKKSMSRLDSSMMIISWTAVFLQLVVFYILWHSLHTLCHVSNVGVVGTCIAL